MSFKISVIHPTARIAPPYPSFPTGWLESCEAFAARADHPEDIEYVLSVHESNWIEFCERSVGLFSLDEDYGFPDEIADSDMFGFGLFKVVKNTRRNCVVDQGRAACEAATGEILMGSMDDLFPPEHWDTLIREHFIGLEHYPGVLHVRTGSPSDDALFVPQICTRALFQERGYLLHPSYEGMFADNEFTEHAKRDGIVIDGRHIVFEHRHPIFGTAKTDSIYEGENREQAYRDGLVNFQHRQALGFPKESEPQHALKKLSIALCLPGEMFNQQWVAGAFDVFDDLAYGLNMKVMVQLGFTSNVYCTRMQIADALLPENPDLWLWIDDDNRLSKQQLRWLLEDLARHPELDAVVGWCWCDSGPENDNWVMSCGHQDEEMRQLRLTAKDVAAVQDTPLLPIEWSGFPCVLIRGAAMEQLGSAAFRPIIKEGLQFGFCSEDAAFWWAFRHAGFKLAVDLRCEVQHMKYRILRPLLLPESAVKIMQDAVNNGRALETAMP